MPQKKKLPNSSTNLLYFLKVSIETGYVGNYVNQMSVYHTTPFIAVALPQIRLAFLTCTHLNFPQCPMPIYDQQAKADGVKPWIISRHTLLNPLPPTIHSRNAFIELSRHPTFGWDYNLSFVCSCIIREFQRCYVNNRTTTRTRMPEAPQKVRPQRKRVKNPPIWACFPTPAGAPEGVG